MSQGQMKDHPSEEKKKIEDQEESQEKGTIFKKREQHNSLGSCSRCTCAFIATSHVGSDPKKSTTTLNAYHTTLIAAQVGT